MALQYREVTGFFTARIPDSGDADLNPDTVPLTGNVAFHPEYRKPLVFPGEHIVLEPIYAIIIDGQLMVEVIQGEDVVLQALHLPVTMDERANQTWSWVMRFNGMTLGQYGETVELPDVRFVIEEGDGPLDLSTVPQTTGRGSNTFITRGEPGPGITGITASGGVVTVEWEGGDHVTIPIPTAALATPTSDGLMSAVDKTRIDATGRDTGWRNILGYAPTAIGGKLVCRRVGAVIEIVGEGLHVAGTGTFDFTDPLGAGWRPARAIYAKTVDYWSGTVATNIRVWSDARLRGQFGGTIDPEVYFQVVYTTTDAWPATLPGTPA